MDEIFSSEKSSIVDVSHFKYAIFSYYIYLIPYVAFTVIDISKEPALIAVVELLVLSDAVDISLTEL
jgi:hypothetical protein